MKVSCQNSIKFKRLKRALKLPHWQVVGVLESLWLLTQVNAPKGDIGRLSDEDIAAGIEWDGDAAEFVSALVDAEFLDRCEVNRLVIHDWSDHAPTWLKGALAKNNAEFAKPVDTADTCSAKQPAKQPAKQSPEQPAKQAAKHGATLPSVLLPSVTSCSVPSFSCSPSASPHVERAGESNGSTASDGQEKDTVPASPAEYPADFLRFWDAYPRVRRQNKGDALKAWTKAKRLAPAEVIIQAAGEYAQSNQGSGQFSILPDRWLRARSWEDDREAWNRKDERNGNSHSSQKARTYSERMALDPAEMVRKLGLLDDDNDAGDGGAR